MDVPNVIAAQVFSHVAAIGLVVAGMFSASPAHAADMPAAGLSGKYQFDRTISREVLENYLARSISVEGVFNGRGDLDDNIRMLKSLGVKYAGRSLCLWVPKTISWPIWNGPGNRSPRPLPPIPKWSWRLAFLRP